MQLQTLPAGEDKKFVKHIRGVLEDSSAPLGQRQGKKDREIVIFQIPTLDDI